MRTGPPRVLEVKTADMVSSKGTNEWIPWGAKEGEECLIRTPEVPASILT